MNRSQSKYFNTAVRMNEALISLLEKKDFQYITVKEICDKAEVNRSTFYLHYETIGDLLSETIEYTMSRLEGCFADTEYIDSSKIMTCPVDKLLFITPEYLVPYLNFVKENRAIFKVAVTQPSVVRVNEIFNKHYDEIFAPVMKRYGVNETDSIYKLTFYLNGMFAVIIRWIKNSCADDIPYIAKLIMQCVFPDTEMLK